MKNHRIAWSLALAGALSVGSASYAANTLGVVAGGLNGTSFKMQVDIDGTNNNVYVETAHPTDEGHYLMRFWVGRDAATPGEELTFVGNSSIRIGALADDANGQRIILFLKKNPNNTIHVNTWHLQDTGGFTFGCTIFLSGSAASVPRQFELEYTQGPGVNDDEIILKRVDNGNTCTLSGLDMDNFQVDSGRFGLLSGSGVNATGRYNFDEFESYR